MPVRRAEIEFWNKPGASLEDFNRDSAAGAKEASPQYGIIIAEQYRACLRARGWTRAAQHRRRAGIVESNNRRRTRDREVARAGS